MAKAMVTKRNGEVADFDEARIRNAIAKAFVATNVEFKQEMLDKLVEGITAEIEQRFTDFFPNVENIQDLVEKHLMLAGHYEVAKAYILYRQKRQKEREEEKKKTVEKLLLGKLTIKKRGGRTVLFNIRTIKENLLRASSGYEGAMTEEMLNLCTKEVIKNLYDGATAGDVENALVLGTSCFIERDPDFSFISAQLFLQKLYKEVMAESIKDATLPDRYRQAFIEGIQKGAESGMFDRRLLDFDLEKLSSNLILDRDRLFGYIGIRTLYERYFVQSEDRKLELPQSFWMRVAMGLAVNEKDKNKRALEFYSLISSMKYVPSTPTLFHSGTTHPQLSSCYLTTIKDDLNHIFKCMGDNAQLAKWSGGIGNDWSNIRATGSRIKSTNVESQGVIPFLKIANDVTAAINRSGKRRGATCAYLETWHLDIEEFLDLRKNTGDDRRRTHDMNTANWIPDLFMKRVIADENWTLFSPEEVPELHHAYGRKFEKKYTEYEEKAMNGQIRKHKVVPARKLYRKMLSMLYETGHPWITFKDPCNIRSPQDHVGVVHSSNLCTEITLNTSETETAVCNLGSINLGKHIVDGKLDRELLAETVKTAIRMLDNVIDINYYPTIEAKNSNLRHRPIGLGIMGFQDALYKLNLSYEHPSALKFSDHSMEVIAYHAILASSELAKEKGTYESYEGSKWDRGIFPQDTMALLEEERGMKIDLPKDESLDWTEVREHVRKHGMHNSNTMAIAPTATISNIAGCYPCIEPIYKNIYVKSNITGEFTVVNSYLVEDLKRLGMWNQDMLEQIKYFDGNISPIANIPQELKDKYREAFDIDSLVAIRMTALRGRWIDQSQSHNVFMKGTSGKILEDIYIHAWKAGLKTTYYLRSLAVTQIEKSTLDAAKYGFTQKREYNGVLKEPAANAPEAKIAAKEAQKVKKVVIAGAGGAAPKMCKLEDPDCEACQ